MRTTIQAKWILFKAICANNLNGNKIELIQ